MGNLCVSDQKKYNQIKTCSDENESEINLDVFDINVARKNSKSISVDSKNIYEEHMENVLPKLIMMINKSIEKSSSELDDHIIIYIHQDNCDLKSIDRQYRKDEYDRFYMDKLEKEICQIYNKKGYRASINKTRGYLFITWKSY